VTTADRQQRTLAAPAHVEGFGFWSGRDVQVEFRPAPAGSGVVFVRRDLQPARRIPVCAANRIEIPRRTSLAHQGARVEMVEHILAALAGLEIDNCEIRVDAAEMPGCDGSSLPFVLALQAAGVVLQDAPRGQLIVRELVRVGSDDSWVEARPALHGGLHVQYRLDYGRQGPIGRQTFKTRLTRDVFVRELAPARTFILKQEAEWLRSQGLAQRASQHDVLVFDEYGVIDNQLRFENECVRHKTLDLIGDLALAGCEIVGQIVAHRSGHRLNAELVRALLTEGELRQARRVTA